MSASLTRIKRFHSPARKFQVEVSPVRQSIMSLSKLRTRKLRHASSPKSSNPCKSFTKVAKYPYFNPITVKEVFLIDPSENSRVLVGCKTPVMENLKFKRSETSDRAQNFLSNYIENTWKKLEIHRSPKSDSYEQAAKYFKLIKNNEVSEIKSLLAKYPELIKSVDTLGMNGLHWAALRNNAAIGKLLVNYKINFNLQDCLGRTALSIAKKYKSTDFLEFFSELSFRRDTLFRAL